MEAANRQRIRSWRDRPASAGDGLPAWVTIDNSRSPVPSYPGSAALFLQSLQFHPGAAARSSGAGRAAPTPAPREAADATPGSCSAASSDNGRADRRPATGRPARRRGPAQRCPPAPTWMGRRARPGPGASARLGGRDGMLGQDRGRRRGGPDPVRPARGHRVPRRAFREAAGAGRSSGAGGRHAAAAGRAGGRRPPRPAPGHRWPWRTLLAAAGGLVLVLAFPGYGLSAWPCSVPPRWRSPSTGSGSAPGCGSASSFGLAFFVPLLSWSGIYVGPVPWLRWPSPRPRFLAPLGGAPAATSRLPAWPLWAAAALGGRGGVRGAVALRRFPLGPARLRQTDGPLVSLAAYGGAPLVTLRRRAARHPAGRRGPRAGAGPGGAAGTAGAARGRAGGAGRSAAAPRSPAAGRAARRRARPGRRWPATRSPTGSPHRPRSRSSRATCRAPAWTSTPSAGPCSTTTCSARSSSPTAAAAGGSAAARPGALAGEQLRHRPVPQRRTPPGRSTGPPRRSACRSWSARSPTGRGRVRQQHRASSGTPTTGPATPTSSGTRCRFGEYIPPRDFVRLLQRRVDRVRRDFVAGDQLGRAGRRRRPGRRRDLLRGGLRRPGPRRRRGGAGMLVVQTNNATFGRTDETAQQLAMSRLRAVEHGRTVRRRGDQRHQRDRRARRRRSLDALPAAVHARRSFVEDIAQRASTTVAHAPRRRPGVGADRARAPARCRGVAGRLVPARRERTSDDAAARPRGGPHLQRGRQPRADAGPAARGGPGGRTCWSSTTAARTAPASSPTSSPPPTRACTCCTAARRPASGPAYIAGFRWALERRLRRRGRDGRRRLARAGAAAPAAGRARDADLVLGSRYVPGGAVTRLAGVPAAALPRRQPLHPLGCCGYRCATRPAATGPPRAELDGLQLRRGRQPGLLLPGRLGLEDRRAGARVVEVPITFTERVVGRSKMSGSIVSEALVRVTVWGLQDRLADRLPGRVRRPVPELSAGGERQHGMSATSVGRRVRTSSPVALGAGRRRLRPRRAWIGFGWTLLAAAGHQRCSAGCCWRRQGIAGLADAQRPRPDGPAARPGRARRRRADRRRRAAHGAARLRQRRARAALPAAAAPAGCSAGPWLGWALPRLPGHLRRRCASTASGPARWTARHRGRPAGRRSRWSSRARSSSPSAPRLMRRRRTALSESAA